MKMNATLSNHTEAALLEKLLLRYRIEQFYNFEAELLDTRQFLEWLDLLSENIRYFMPVATNKEFGTWDEEYSRAGEDLNWFDEGKFELEQRVRQILTGVHWCEEPISRTSHIITNLLVSEVDDGSWSTKCRFLIYRNRNETETDFFIGKRSDKLIVVQDSFKIAERKIFLDQSVLQAKNLSLFF